MRTLWKQIIIWKRIRNSFHHFKLAFEMMKDEANISIINEVQTVDGVTFEIGFAKALDVTNMTACIKERFYIAPAINSDHYEDFFGSQGLHTAPGYLTLRVYSDNGKVYLRLSYDGKPFRMEG